MEQIARPDILVVEDDTLTRHVLTQLLRGEGYAVTSVTNGQEAIDRLRIEGAARLIIADLMMPVMDGWELQGELKQDPAFSSIPVLVLSADSATGQKAAALGATDYLQKPVELQDLLDTVHRHLETASPKG